MNEKGQTCFASFVFPHNILHFAWCFTIMSPQVREGKDFIKAEKII